MAPTTPQEILEAIEHLPSGARLIVHDVSWEDYERISGNFVDCGPRISYDCGRLEVVVNSNRHGWYEATIGLLVFEFCLARGLECDGYGHATWQLKPALKAVEADACFYISNAPRVRKDDVSLERGDPPPDIAIEIDLTTDSKRKFSIYSGLGVPEVWRYDGKVFHFYELRSGKYVEIPGSLSLQGLTSQVLTEAFEISRAKGQQEAVKLFRKRIQKLKK